MSLWRNPCCATKASGSNTYLQIVGNRRDGKKVRQRATDTLDRLGHLRKTGDLDRPVQSASVLRADHGARRPAGDGEDGAEVRRIGPALTFERPPGDPARRGGSQSHQRGLAARHRKRRPGRRVDLSRRSRAGWRVPGSCAGGPAGYRAGGDCPST